MTLDILAIRESFERVKPIAGQVATRFYAHLWEKYPASKALFANISMDKQKVVLMKAISLIVDQLDRPDQLTTYLKSMGSRHVDYGTLPEHYPWVGDALLTTLREFLGEGWTPYLEKQWGIALSFIAETMILGAKETEKLPGARKIARDSQDQPVSWTTEVHEATIEIPRELKALIRTKVRQRVRQLIQEEIDGALAAERRDLETIDFDAYLKKAS